MFSRHFSSPCLLWRELKRPPQQQPPSRGDCCWSRTGSSSDLQPPISSLFRGIWAPGGFVFHICKPELQRLILREALNCRSRGISTL